jgi:nucleoside phosphorylase
MMNLDIAVFIALKEEFELVFQRLGPIPTNEIESRLGQWYVWQFKDYQNNIRKAFFTFIGDMGPNHALMFTTKFLENYHPNILINFGLSGTLNKDVKIGDIVVATLTDLYEDAGAVEDINSVPCLRPSGLPIRTPEFKRHIENFQYKLTDEYNRWESACKNLRQKLIEKIIPEDKNILIGQEVTIHTGHVACGNVVVKSNSWKNMLLSKDRKYYAVDMESGAIAFTVDDMQDVEKTKLLIIRVISDPANELKSILDGLGEENQGVLRKSKTPI